MAEDDSITARFEASRPRLRAVAYRMLGSRTEAEDAVQEAWLRLDRTGPEQATFSGPDDAGEVLRMVPGGAAGSVRSLCGMDTDFALKFAEEWQAAWNAHDLERILAHYADDVLFQSPYVVHRLQEPTGEVRGKDALRSYWGSGLQQQPTLRFTVEDVRVSVDTLVINYRNERGHAVSEVLRFRGDLVSWGCGAYAPGDSLAAATSYGPERN